MGWKGQERDLPAGLDSQGALANIPALSDRRHLRRDTVWFQIHRRQIWDRGQLSHSVDDDLRLFLQMQGECPGACPRG